MCNNEIIIELECGLEIRVGDVGVSYTCIRIIKPIKILQKTLPFLILYFSTQFLEKTESFYSSCLLRII